METYRSKSAIVLWRLKERGFSESSIRGYRRIFSSIENYLNEKEVIYSPDLGEEMLALNEDAFFKDHGPRSLVFGNWDHLAFCFRRNPWSRGS